MKRIRPITLLFCSTAIASASLFWSNPAQARLLRFTGWSSNGAGAAIEFDINQDVDLLTLSDGTYEDLVSNLSLINLAFGNSGDIISSDDPGPADLQRSYFSSTDIAFDLTVFSEPVSFSVDDGLVSGGLINKAFTVVFDVSLEEPAILNQPNNITGTLRFGVGSELNLFEFEDENPSNNDGFFDGTLDLGFDISFVEGGLYDYVPSGAVFFTDLLAEENPADVPEGGSALGFLLFSLLGTTLLKKQMRFRKVV